MICVDSCHSANLLLQEPEEYYPDWLPKDRVLQRYTHNIETPVYEV